MRNLFHLGVSSLLIAGVVGLSGCGDTDSEPEQTTTTVTSTVTAEPTAPTPKPETPGPASPRPTPPPTAADPTSVVRAYFAAINARDYERAWDLGGKNFSDSYEAFVDGFATTARDTVHILRAEGSTVRVRLEAMQTDGTLRVFEGTYTVRNGTIVSADVREVPESEPRPQPSEVSPYYENCDAAEAAGVTPLYKGDPGYGPHLDRDGDGVACEPYPP
ncbi:excalibur calcium-binding domain-containing protein [Streptomyces sp. NPDC002851]